MKRLVAAGVILAGVLTLAGCRDDDPNRETHTERIDRLYSECVRNGGSFEYNGSLPYWQCVQGEPGTGE